MSLNQVIAASEGGRDRNDGRGLQLGEAGVGWGPGVCSTPWYQVLVSYTLIGSLGYRMGYRRKQVENTGWGLTQRCQQFSNWLVL